MTFKLVFHHFNFTTIVERMIPGWFYYEMMASNKEMVNEEFNGIELIGLLVMSNKMLSDISSLFVL